MVVQKNIGEATIITPTIQNCGISHNFWLEMKLYHQDTSSWSNAAYMGYIGDLDPGASIPIAWSWTAGDNQGAGS